MPARRTPRGPRSPVPSPGRFPQGAKGSLLLLLALAVAAPPALAEEVSEPSVRPEAPWRQAGLSERQAAAHLLDRFAFGARPGDVDRVVEMGVDAWLERQLAGAFEEPGIAERLRGFRSLELSARQASELYPPPGLVLREARREGAVSEAEMAAVLERGNRGEEPAPGGRRDGMGGAIRDYARERGYRPQRELIGEMMVQKLYRALYAENQLAEVLVDFWFNHFNVSITDNESRVYVASYERDAIRPHVLGDFREMLEATAKHPAMLLYLDNARSVADEGAPTTLDRRVGEMRARFGRGGGGRSGGGRSGFGRQGNPGRRGGFGGTGMDPETRRRIEERRPQGLNENYARELLELHTLGVDGGYGQEDVVEVARAFTGWATYPPGARRGEIEARIERARRIPGAGFVFEESFLFRADAHDAGKKTVLGRKLAAGRGIEDGLEVLDLLAAHPSTARHLATKLAVRFVSDAPPASLVDRLAGRFLASGGDLGEVMRTLAWSPEFWSPEARAAKIKSPFELAASALRSLGADVFHPRAVVEWISQMGQPLYAYQAPTGYPDEAEAWVNTGALLNRMNFGLQLATGRVPGVRFDLAALNGHREPESLVAALETYVPLLMPERDPAPTVERLEPVILDPDLARKVEEAAPAGDGVAGWDDWGLGGETDGPRGDGRGFPGRFAPPPPEPDDRPLAHVVGVILGSPEFQRR